MRSVTLLAYKAMEGNFEEVCYGRNVMPYSVMLVILTGKPTCGINIVNLLTTTALSKSLLRIQ